MGDKRIDVQIIFEDRTYQLGETIDVAVYLTASKPTNVSETKLLLRCEESYSKDYSATVYERTGNIPGSPGPMGGAGSGPMPSDAGGASYKNRREGSHKHHEVIFEDRLSLGANFSMNAREKKRLAGKFTIRPALPLGDIFEDSPVFTFVAEIKVKSLLGTRTITEEKPVKIIPYLSRVKPRNG